MVFGHEKFKERFGESPCIVGQCPGDPDDEKYIEENRERLDAIYGRWLIERGA